MRSPETKKLVPVNNLMRKSAAFWEVVSERGMEVDVVTWYVSWPAQQINGTFVSERLVFPELDHVVAPAAWSDALAHHNDTYISERAERLKKFTPHPYNPDYRSLNRNSQAFFRDEHLSILDFTHRKDTVAFGIAKDLLYQRQPDVFAEVMFLRRKQIAMDRPARQRLERGAADEFLGRRRQHDGHLRIGLHQLAAQIG